MVVEGWTPRDLGIVEALAAKVCLLSLRQIALGWWAPSKRTEEHAAERLRTLAKAGLVQRYEVNAHPPLDLVGPVVSWCPGEPEPDGEDVSRRLRERWTEASTPTTVYAASKLAANVFGCSGGELPSVEHRDHDLLLGEVFIRYRREAPDLASRWVGEAARPKAGYRIKDPDAFLVDAAGKVTRVIESGGKYDRERVEAFHRHCVAEELPYELW
jgi:hypothetical protein